MEVYRRQAFVQDVSPGGQTVWRRNPFRSLPGGHMLFLSAPDPFTARGTPPCTNRHSSNSATSLSASGA